jgi:omega-6 fatty acid desaturase (delta-12 desaturase)
MINKNAISVTGISKINESELFTKYKARYKSAFIDLSLHGFLLSSCFYFLWLFRNSWISCLTIPLVGLLNVKTFIIFHDSCHDSYTPNKTLNYIISHITGIINIISPLWCLDHNIHHLTNGNKENKYNYKYNELIDYTENEYIKMSQINKLMFNLFYNYKTYFTLFPFLYFFVIQRFIYIIKKLKYKGKIPQSLIYIIFNHLVNNTGIVLMFYIISKYNLLYHYIFSLYISFVLGFILFHNQHTFNPPYIVNNESWNMKNSGLLGSSFIQIPIFLKYFSGGIEYHHIHHINAKIPGYNLQKYHEEVVSTSNLFDNIVKLSMVDCYNNLKLRLFSEKKNRYIRLDEVENNQLLTNILEENKNK